MQRRSLLTAALTLAAATALASDVPAAPDTASPYAVTDTDLFTALDYAAYPALAPVQKAVQAADMPAAKREFAAYLRARTTVPWDSAPPRPDERATTRWSAPAADRALRGDVTVVTVPHAFPEGAIDWFYNATGGTTGLPANSEWQWQLCRMAWWNDLGRAYRATGDEKWASAWVRQIRGWFAQCPPPAHVANGAKSAWRTIECGIRMSGIWPASYQTFLRSPSFTDDDLIAYVETMVAHGRYLSANHTGGNWLTMEMNGLYGVGALFPELKEATAWRRQAGDALYKEIAAQFLPDGAQFELTPGYHNVAVDNVLGLYQRALLTGHAAELSPDYLARMEHAFDYDLLLMTPDRSLPRFNDSWPYNVPGRMIEAARLFPARTDFAWVATNGKSGTPPSAVSHPFPYAGYYAMRDNWGRDACLGVLDAGPLGNGHYHQDKLNFVAWAFGRELLYDCGGGSYEQSRYRAYATDTFGHNTVLVDNKPQRRNAKDHNARVSDAPIDAHWESLPDHDFVEGVYSDGYGTETDRIARHTRRVLFVKATPYTPPFWIVSDRLVPADALEHTYQARWNLLATAANSGTGPAEKAVFTADTDKPNLAIAPILIDSLKIRIASAETQPEILGWNVRKDMDPQYVPATTVLHTLTGTGECRFLTLVLPLKPGEKNPITAIAKAGLGGHPPGATGDITLASGVRLTIDERDDGGLYVGILPVHTDRMLTVVGGKRKSA